MSKYTPTQVGLQWEGMEGQGLAGDGRPPEQALAGRPPLARGCFPSAGGWGLLVSL